ncbi:hypothetical protein [Sphingomonas sp. RS2018]
MIGLLFFFIVIPAIVEIIILNVMFNLLRDGKQKRAIINIVCVCAIPIQMVIYVLVTTDFNRNDSMMMVWLFVICAPVQFAASFGVLEYEKYRRKHRPVVGMFGRVDNDA